MSDQRREQFFGLLMIFSKLAAAKGVRKGIQSLNAARHQMLIPLNQLSGYGIDTAHRGNHLVVNCLIHKAVDDFILHTIPYDILSCQVSCHDKGCVRAV